MIELAVLALATVLSSSTSPAKPGESRLGRQRLAHGVSSGFLARENSRAPIGAAHATCRPDAPARGEECRPWRGSRIVIRPNPRLTPWAKCYLPYRG